MSEALASECPLAQLITEDRDTGNGYYLTCRHFEAANEVEVVAIRLEEGDSLKRGGGARRKNADKEAMDDATLWKSISRARSNLRRKVLSMSADRMLTTTFRDNVTDMDEAWSVFKYFTKLMRQRYGKRFAYVAVPEFQKRGAVHFHIALNDYYHVNTVRRLWRRAAGHRGGNIDITSPKKFGKNSWNPKRIAQYISKYISKSESVSFNRRRFSSGGDIVVPDPQRAWLAFGVPLVSVIRDWVYSKSRKQMAVVWESEGFLGINYFST